MPTMTSYRHGVPSWVDVSAPDVDAGVAFYTSVFAWDVTPDMGPDSGGYRLFLKAGVPVAGIGPLGEGHPSWTTYFHVDDLDAVAARVAGLGGTLVVPPMDLPNDSGRMAFAFDPTGGFFGLHQSGPNHIGAVLVNEADTFAWNELNVRDMATATAFYDGLLGTATAAMDPNAPHGYHLVTVQGRPVAGAMLIDESFPADMPTSWTTYFAVDDLAAAVARCTAAGGGVMVPPFDTPVGQMSIVHDPSGAVFALGQFIAIDDPNNWPD